MLFFQSKIKWAPHCFLIMSHRIDPQHHSSGHSPVTLLFKDARACRQARALCAQKEQECIEMSTKLQQYTSEIGLLKEVVSKHEERQKILESQIALCKEWVAQGAQSLQRVRYVAGIVTLLFLLVIVVESYLLVSYSNYTWASFLEKLREGVAIRKRVGSVYRSIQERVWIKRSSV